MCLTARDRKQPRGHRKPHLMAAAVAVLILAIAAPVTHPGADQQASRYALTAALWDHQTFELGRYDDLLGRDRAVRGDRVYSDKAPLQPVLAVPFYGMSRAVGGVPAETLVGPFGWFSYGLWWVTVWSAAVPAAIIAGMMYLWSREIEPSAALAATLGLALGTLLLVYSTLLFGHVVGGLAILAMFLLVRTENASAPRLLAAGVVGGAAVLIEYPLALPVIVITGAAVALHKRRGAFVFLGGFPAAGLLAFYNWALFGSALTLSYQWSAFVEPPKQAAETLEIFAGPSFERFLSVLFSPRGLFVATPVVLAALLGLVLMWRRGRRVDVLVPGLVFASLLMVQFSWGSSFAGGAGARYLTPALPFLVAPLAVAWSEWRVATPLLAGFSVITTVLATFTNPQLPSEFHSGLEHWLVLAADGLVAETVFTLRFGATGRLVHVLLVGLAILMIVRLRGRPGPETGAPSAIPAKLS